MFDNSKMILYVLSGGGARGIECHTGILRALEEANIKPNKLKGTSAGAIISVLYASGYKARDIEQIIRNNPFNELVKRRWGVFWWLKLYGSLYDRSNLDRLIREKVGEDTIFRNVRVTVTRKLDGKTEYMFGSADTAIASSSIPVIFPSYKLGRYYYVDGGIHDNIPTPPACFRKIYKHIYIMVCNDDIDRNRHYRTHLGRGLRWMDEVMEREYAQMVDDWGCFPNVTIIKPPPFKSSLLNWSENYGLIEHAYEYTKELLQKKKKEK